jgi:hypothetical protein
MTGIERVEEVCAEVAGSWNVRAPRDRTIAKSIHGGKKKPPGAP